MIARTVGSSAVEQRRPFELGHRILHRDGDVRWVREYAQVVFDADGRPVYLDGIIFDIADRKAFEAASASPRSRPKARTAPNRNSGPS